MKKIFFSTLWLLCVSIPIQIYAEPQTIYWNMDENIVIDDNGALYISGDNNKSSFKKIDENVSSIYPSNQGDRLYYIIDKEGVLYEVTEQEKKKIDSDVKTVTDTRYSVDAGIQYIKTDNSLWAVCKDQYGELNDGDDKNLKYVKIMENVVKASSLGDTFFILTADNELFIWGDCSSLIDSSKFGFLSTPTKVLENVSDYSFKTYMSTGNIFGMYLDTSGFLYAWEMSDGLFGSSGKSLSFSETPQLLMKDVLSFEIYAYSALILKKDMTLWSWGENYCNIADDENISIIDNPKKIEQNVKEFSYFYKFVLILKQDGDLVRYSDMREPHTISSGYEYGLYKDTALKNAEKILVPKKDCFARGKNTTAYVLGKDNVVYGMGNNFFGNLGNETTDKIWVYEPVEIKFLTDLYNKDNNLSKEKVNNRSQKINNSSPYILICILLVSIILVCRLIKNKNDIV